jgi:hypothetical protein
MSITDSVRNWNVTPDERRATYPCESYAEQPYSVYLRAIDVDAPAHHVFRWMCQLKVAPYSYDWVDNFGRRSPSALTPGAEQLCIGQHMMIANITEFETDRQITAVSTPRVDRLFGKLTFTYQVTATDTDRSRLVVCMTVTAASLPSRVRRALLGAGDLVMMRKQLLTLKAHAEATRPTGAAR